MSFVYQFLFLIVTYFVASVPFGMIIAKVFSGQDIRKVGSGNIGATNVTRVLGKKFGLLTLILDGLKGAAMVVAARFIFSDAKFLNDFLVLVALVAVLGHIFPIYLKFKGGKGVATALAVLVTINPIIGFVGCLAWLIVFAFTKTSSMASLAAMAIATGFTFYSHALPEEILLCVALTILIFIRHKENISRIIKDEEKKIG